MGGEEDGQRYRLKLMEVEAIDAEVEGRPMPCVVANLADDDDDAREAVSETLSESGPALWRRRQIEPGPDSTETV